MSVETKTISRLIADKSFGFQVVEPSTKPDFANIFYLLDSIKQGLAARGHVLSDYVVKTPTFFLENPVTNDQRKLLDEELGPLYAAESIALQKKVAKVEIRDIGERLVFLPEIFSGSNVKATFSEIPFNAACGEWAGKQRQFWVRESMATKLLSLGNVLKDTNIYMHFEDAFRPVGVQEGLFQRRVRWIVEQHPDWDKNMVIQEAMSKTAVTPRLSSHKSGAAVDVTLMLYSGKPLDIGNKYPEGGALVSLNCPFVTKDQWYARQIFAGAFTMAGFTNYSGEDWHASFGDNLAGIKDNQIVTNYIAMYGPIKRIDYNSGNILEYYDIDEIDVPFSSDVDNLTTGKK